MGTDFIACAAMCCVVAVFVFAAMSQKSGSEAGLILVCFLAWMAFLAFVLMPYREKYGKHLPQQIARDWR